MGDAALAATAPTVPVAPMAPAVHRVTRVRRDAPGTVTLGVVPAAGTPASPRPRPGQFQMLYAFGVGEIPISVSGLPDPADPDGAVEHTVRAVGATSAALCALEAGHTLGVRGPFGTGFDLPDGGTVVVVAGGLGLAPLRPVVLAAARRAESYDRVVVVVAARSPEAVLWRDQLDDWSARPGVEVAVTVDAATGPWVGEVGPVTSALRTAAPDPATTTAMVCGPEIMMRVVADHLAAAGVDPARIQVSLERSMGCAVALCGRCQLGSELLCRDGAVLPYRRVRAAMAVPQR